MSIIIFALTIADSMLSARTLLLLCRSSKLATRNWQLASPLRAVRATNGPTAKTTALPLSHSQILFARSPLSLTWRAGPLRGDESREWHSGRCAPQHPHPHQSARRTARAQVSINSSRPQLAALSFFIAPADLSRVLLWARRSRCARQIRRCRRRCKLICSRRPLDRSRALAAISLSNCEFVAVRAPSAGRNYTTDALGSALATTTMVAARVGSGATRCADSKSSSTFALVPFTFRLVRAADERVDCVTEHSRASRRRWQCATVAGQTMRIRIEYLLGRCCFSRLRPTRSIARQKRSH